MLGSRFWYLLLAAAGAAALAAAFLGRAAFNRQYDDQLNDQLRRDRFEIELMLRMDARTRIDKIAPIAAHQDVRRALRSASGRRNRNAVDDEQRSALTETLRTLNSQLEEMAADMLFAVDDRGYIIAQVGPGELPAGAGLGAFPLVERALSGYVRDDTWIYNDVVYRTSARPVIDGGQYVGAIVHAMTIDDELARRLSERLGNATVAFFRGETLVGSHMPSVEGAAQGADVAAKLSEALTDERIREGNRTDPLDLGNDTSRGVYSLVHGSAAASNVGYAIARPRSVLTSPSDLFDQVADQDVQELPWFLILGFGIGGFAIAMVIVWLERDRPVGKLRRASTALAEGKLPRFDLGAHGGAYRKIAQDVNAAIDKAVEEAGASSPRRPADLDAILGPSPEEPPGNAFFGFAAHDDGSIPPPPGMAGDAGVPAAPAPPAPPPPGPPGPAAGPPPPAPPAPPPPAPPAPAAPPPPAAPAVPGKPDWAKGTLMGVGADEGGVGAGPYQAAPNLSDPIDDDDDVSTMVAQVPQELLQASNDGQSEEDRHFAEVYERFIETKKACNESTAGLTLEKFTGTLKKNRDQIMSRHGAARVRFTVYVKAGKAALKATPVK